MGTTCRFLIKATKFSLHKTLSLKQLYQILEITIMVEQDQQIPAEEERNQLAEAMRLQELQEQIRRARNERAQLDREGRVLEGEYLYWRNRYQTLRRRI